MNIDVSVSDDNKIRIFNSTIHTDWWNSSYNFYFLCIVFIVSGIRIQRHWKIVMNAKLKNRSSRFDNWCTLVMIWLNRSDFFVILISLFEQNLRFWFQIFLYSFLFHFTIMISSIFKIFTIIDDVWYLARTILVESKKVFNLFWKSTDRI